MAINNKIPFDEQGFMWDLISKFQNKSPQEGVTSRTSRPQQDDVKKTPDPMKWKKWPYDHFTQIQSKQPIGMINKMIGNGVDALNDLTTAQLSNLIPKIKLYKLVPRFKPTPVQKAKIEGAVDEGSVLTSTPIGTGAGGGRSGIAGYAEFDETTITIMKEVPELTGYTKHLFPFGGPSKAFGVGSITDSFEKRGTDAGIKSLNIRDTGVNPANVGISWKGTIDLYFQSVQSLFLERNVAGDKLTFAQLMDLTSLTGTEYRGKNKIPSEILRQAAASLNCMPPYEIQLELGWQIGDEKDSLNIPKERINSLTRRFKLYPAQQQMNINEDGSLTLSLDFWAAVEAKSLGSAADLLYIDPQQQAGITKKIQKARKDYYAEKVNVMSERREKLSAMEVSAGDPSKGSSATQEQNAATHAALQALEDGEQNEKLEEAKKAYGAATSNSREFAYGRLLHSLRHQTRLFSLDLPPFIITDYLDMLALVGDMGQVAKTDLEHFEENKETISATRTSFLEHIRQDLQLINPHIGNNDLFGLTPGEQTSRDNEANGGEVASPVTATQDAQAGSQTNSNKPRPVPPGYYRINYFYLGDLLEAAMSVIYGQAEYRSKDESSKKSFCKVIKNHVKLLVGPYVHTDPVTGKITVMNVADIPVSLRYFNGWFFKTVTQHKKNHLPLREFLKNLCASLINNLVRPQRMGGMAELKPVQPQVQTLNLPYGGLVDRYGKLGDPKTQGPKGYGGLKIIDWDNLSNKQKDLAHATSGGKKGQTSDWLFLYMAGDAPVTLNGKEFSDKVWNIPHFWVGRNKGILKKVNFSRTKLAFRLEASLQRGEDMAKRNLLFADRYDAELTFAGNPAFKPGMFIYINAASLGLGGGIDGGPLNPSNPEWQSDLGVGGYYRITDVTHQVNADSFETKLRTISELSTRDMKLRKFKSAIRKGKIKQAELDRKNQENAERQAVRDRILAGPSSGQSTGDTRGLGGLGERMNEGGLGAVPGAATTLKGSS